MFSGNLVVNSSVFKLWPPWKCKGPGMIVPDRLHQAAVGALGCAEWSPMKRLQPEASELRDAEDTSLGSPRPFATKG